MKTLLLSSLMFLIIAACNGGTYTTFPAGSCRAQDCATHNPYELVPVGEFRDSAERSKSICFRIDYKGCDDNDSECCNTLERILEKIAIKVNPQCGRASYTDVTIDGVKKGGGVYFDENLGFSELRITSLRWNASTGVGKTICINGLRAPCPDAHSFCRDEKDKDNIGCVYTVYDPFSHRCCPTCAFEDFSSSIPTNPSPPPPRSLSPTMVMPPSPPIPIPTPMVVSPSPPRPPLSLSPRQPMAVVARLVVKIPLDGESDDGMMNILCDELEDAVYAILLPLKEKGGLLCKQLLKSTTGIYYGLVIELGNVESDKKKLIAALQEGRMSNFTSIARLKCGSTVTLTTPPSDFKFRYMASQVTCY
jgi:hypothetical protein